MVLPSSKSCQVLAMALRKRASRGAVRGANHPAIAGPRILEVADCQRLEFIALVARCDDRKTIRDQALAAIHDRRRQILEAGIVDETADLNQIPGGAALSRFAVDGNIGQSLYIARVLRICSRPARSLRMLIPAFR